MTNDISIALIAFTDYHQEYYSELIKKLNSQNINCLLFCSNNLRKEIQLPSSVKIFTDNKKRHFRFLFKHRKLINSCKSIIFDEPYTFDLYLTLYLPFKASKILTIHNARQWFVPKPKTFLGFVKVLNHKLIIKLRLISKFITVNYNAKLFIKRHKPNIEVFFIPFGFSNNKEESKQKESNTIKILIPGMITEKRRDYNIVKDAFSLFSNDIDLRRIELIFLGKPVDNSGKQIISNFKEISKLIGFKFIYFNEYIPKIEFDKHLLNCDFILSNSNVKIKTDYGLIETYGETKESGIISSAIKYSKPIIISQKQKIPNEYSKCSITYSSTENLHEILKNIALNKISTEQFSKYYDIAHKEYKKKIDNEFTLLKNTIKG